MQLKTYRRYAFHVVVAICAIIPHNAHAQQAYTDTLSLSIPKAEEIFLQKNLALLANQYNVDINKALVEQAKVWDNPVLNTDQNIYDGKWFKHGTVDGFKYGQVYLQVQQLIRTAGKIKKLTQLAQDNVQGAEAQFNDVMRNLRFVLTTDLNNLAQMQSSATLYQREMQTMTSLVNGMNAMLQQGDISRKENVRINAALFSLQADYNDNLRQQYDLQKEIAGLLQLNDSVWVKADAVQPIPVDQVHNLQLAMLRDSALQWRPDLLMARNQSLFSQHNISYQKAIAKPDLNVGVEYDQQSSYVPNYWGLAISVPLPVFNRNKGNIAAAEMAYKQSGVMVQQAETQVNKDVLGAWQKLINTSNLMNNTNAALQDNYESLMQNMVSSYQQRQVNLVEFIDFFDSYKETRNRQLHLIADQRNAAAELNFSVNQSIIKL